MHDTAATHGGKFAFLAIYANQRVSEFEKRWDELPPSFPLMALAFICRGEVEDTVLLTLTGTRYYFLNEYVVEPCASGELLERHSGKAFGAVQSDGTVTEVRLDLTGPTPHATQRKLLVVPSFSADLFRSGALWP